MVLVCVKTIFFGKCLIFFNKVLLFYTNVFVQLANANKFIITSLFTKHLNKNFN